MRYILSMALAVLLILSCKKNKYTTAPQITFKSISPNTWLSNTTINNPGPFLNIQVTDAQGDFGFVSGKDTSYIYVQNITIPPFKMDSLQFPNFTGVNTKDLNTTISASLQSVLAQSGRAHYTDTLYFQVYVKDFAKNKSNVIKTGPLFYVTP